MAGRARAVRNADRPRDSLAPGDRAKALDARNASAVVQVVMSTEAPIPHHAVAERGPHNVVAPEGVWRRQGKIDSDRCLRAAWEVEACALDFDVGQMKPETDLPLLHRPPAGVADA